MLKLKAVLSSTDRTRMLSNASFDCTVNEAITPAELDAAVERRMQWREARLWWRD